MNGNTVFVPSTNGGENRQPTCSSNPVNFVPQVNTMTVQGWRDLAYREAEAVMEIQTDYAKKCNTNVAAFQRECDKQEIAEMYRLRRELQTYGICTNSQGYMCREVIDERGKPIRSKALCSAKNINARTYVAYRAGEKSSFFAVFSGENILWGLPGKDLTPESMARGFANAGCPLLTSRDSRKNLNELVMAFLRLHSAEEEIPFMHGWNRMSSGEWRFAASDIGTMEGLNVWRT